MNDKAEQWKRVIVPHRPGLSDIYSISDLGRLRNDISGRILAPKKAVLGYAFYSLSHAGEVKNHYAHRLVAFAFLGSPLAGQEINHKDGDKWNNLPANLEWVTPSENVVHAWDVLKRERPNGEKNAAAKITASDVREMRAWWKTGDVTLAAIGGVWGLTFQTVSQIVNRKRWAHVL